MNDGHLLELRWHGNKLQVLQRTGYAVDISGPNGHQTIPNGTWITIRVDGPIASDTRVYVEYPAYVPVLIRDDVTEGHTYAIYARHTLGTYNEIVAETSNPEHAITIADALNTKDIR